MLLHSILTTAFDEDVTIHRCYSFITHSAGEEVERIET